MTDTATEAPAEPRTLEIMEIRRLLELLPHRYPFLLIDRIIEVDSDRSGIGIKNVTINEPQFQGHFPDRPVMPGVLMIEGMAQTAGAMCVASRTQIGSPKVVYFMTVDKVKFRRPVGPGDVLQYRMKKTRNRANMWWYSGEAWVGDTKVAEAELSAMLVDE